MQRICEELGCTESLQGKDTGYTHYWRIKDTCPKALSDDAFNRIRINVVSAYDGGLIQYECDTAKPPDITPSYIRFNGIGNAGHETFVLDLDPKEPPYRASNGERFDFCKTARKPYDGIVMVVLALAKLDLGDGIEISSDGTLNDNILDPDYAPKPPNWSGQGSYAFEMTEPGFPANMLDAIKNIFTQWSPDHDEWNSCRAYLKRQYGLTIWFDDEGTLQCAKKEALITS